MKNPLDCLIKGLAAGEVDLAISEEEAAVLKGSLNDLREMARTTERVPLPFPGDPFVSPASGDEWLADEA